MQVKDLISQLEHQQFTFLILLAIDMDAKEIIYNDYIDINIAVASDKG